MNDKDQLSVCTENLKMGLDLPEEELSLCIRELTRESISPMHKQNFLKALAQKGETYEEFSIFIREFRKMSVDPQLQEFAPHAIDLCGTGGDKAQSFNISSFVSFVVASAGVPVIKHGNRSISSKCGSADLIEAIGIPLDPPIEKIRECMKTLNFTFLFAPHFHPAFKHIAPVRKSLANAGIITIFNLLGPTINPAKPRNQLLGVFDPIYLSRIGKALTSNNVRSGLVVHGEVRDSQITGVDELTSCGANQVFGIGELATERIEKWLPERWKVETGNYSDLSGGNLAENLKIMKSLLDGNAPDTLRITVLMNAATAFWIQGRCCSMGDGMELAESLLVNGTVKQWLEKVSSFFK